MTKDVKSGPMSGGEGKLGGRNGVEESAAPRDEGALPKVGKKFRLETFSILKTFVVMAGSESPEGGGRGDSKTGRCGSAAV